MQTVRIYNTDLAVGRIGYGCNQFLITDQDSGCPNVLAKSASLVHAARDLGINLFDMVAMYSGGKVEIAFGEVVRQSPGLRQAVIIQTKCVASANSHHSRL